MSRGEPDPGGATSPAGQPENPLVVQSQVGRRTLLLGAVGVVAVAAVGVLRWRDSGLSYRDLAGLKPFRELVSDGGISTASLAFAGLQGGPSDDEAQIEDRMTLARADLCGALFGGASSTDVVPMAYFSDFNCPYCRVLEGEIDDVLAGDPGVHLVRHELPLLGDASVSAAKAVLAADLQGGYEVLKARILRAGLITDAPYLRAVAGPLGLDAERLLAEMESEAVADRLLTSRALGRLFGLNGTPALIVGRTAILGSASARTIGQVIRDERATTGPVCGESL